MHRTDRAAWSVADIPSQRGRSAVVTGTGGLGYQDALALARAGADVIIAGRNPSKGARAVADIRQGVEEAIVRFEILDLASLASVAAFKERLSASRDGIDLLVNNAAVMRPPRRLTTSDGFELQFGTNYLGHFALTAHLLPLLRKGRLARIVNVSSIAARKGVIDFDDLQAERRYRPSAAYRQSKLASLMFALELQRLSEASGWGLTSIAAHPGISATDLIANGAGRMSAMGAARYLLGPILFQSAARGALATLFAATSPNAEGGGYYGPDTLNELRGAPAPAKIPPQALNAHDAQRLWSLSERLCGMTFGPASR